MRLCNETTNDGKKDWKNTGREHLYDQGNSAWRPALGRITVRFGTVRASAAAIGVRGQRIGPFCMSKKLSISEQRGKGWDVASFITTVLQW
jgi:hypothetical protein